MPTLKYLLRYWLFLILLLTATACQEDKLDLLPPDAISEAAIFNTPDRVDKLLFGLYDSMKARGYYGSLFLVFSDVRGEDFLNQRMSTGQGLQVWNHTLEETFSEVNEVWNDIYFTINSCNIFIQGVRDNAAILPTPELALQYEAEAKFIRALAYFNLLTLYARPYLDGQGDNLGVVLRLQPQPGSGNKDQARASVAEVYEQILLDLAFAIEHLNPNFGDAYQNTTRVHRSTAIALQTRILLSMGRYADLITAANKIIPMTAPFVSNLAVPHRLVDQVQNAFLPPYTTSENIFSLPNTPNDPLFTQGAMASFYNLPPTGLGDYSLNPAGIAGAAAWDAQDDRRAFIVDDPDSDKIYLGKYPTGQPYSDFVPVIRYAEVLLNLAEAISRDCDCVDARALALLNAVRERSFPGGGYTAADFATVDDWLEAILLERRIEFVGEGFRSVDCTRLLLPIPGKANVAAVPPSSPEYIWPIPISELAANRLCEPNP